MALSQTDITQKRVFDQISIKMASNPTFLSDLLTAIQNNNIREFNKLTGKSVKSTESMLGYIRLYNSYINKHTKILPKAQQKPIQSSQKPSKSTKKTQKKTSKKKTSKKLSKKTSKKKSVTITKPNKVNVAQLHPFSFSLSNELLSFVLVNNFSIKNSKTNIAKIYDFANNLPTQIALFNAQSSRAIRYARLSIKYKSTDGTTRYFSTPKTVVANIDVEVIHLIDSLTLILTSNWYNISPKNSEFISDLENNNYEIYEFTEFIMRYYY